MATLHNFALLRTFWISAWLVFACDAIMLILIGFIEIISEHSSNLTNGINKVR